MAEDFDTATMGQRIRELRQWKGITQVALAKKVGCSARWIGGIERGQKNITMKLFFRICHALNCLPSVLLGETWDSTSLYSVSRFKS